jgi:UDP-glucose 4-epimerase
MILLTGANGFVGRHLLDALLKKYGHQKVVAYSRSPIAGVKCICHNGYEIQSFNFLSMGLESINIIIHAGAFTPKNKYESNNVELANLNVHVTDSLLNANLPNLQKFIYLSTIDVYASSKIIDEDTLLSPSNAYSKSKMRCEELVLKWSKINGKICQLLRLGHVYGPGEDLYQKIIPETMRRLRDGITLQMFGNGQQRRSYIYVQDVCSAIITSLSLNRHIGPVNVAGRHQVSVIDLIHLMMDVSGVRGEISIVSGSNDQDIIFDTEKMSKYLLKNEVSLRNGLKKEWDYMLGSANENTY